MSDKPKDKPADAPAGDKPADGHVDGEKKPGKLAGLLGLAKKTPVLLGGAMIVEAVVLFAGMKALGGGPDAGLGAELSLEHAEGDDAHGDGTTDDHGEPADDHGASDAHGEADPHAAPAHGDDGHGEASAHGDSAGHGDAAPAKPIDPKAAAFVPLVQARGTKAANGRTYLYQIQLAALTTGKNQKKVESLVADRAALVQDRIRTIVAEIDVEKLRGEQEPGLETFRRQVKYRLNQIAGGEIVDEVLVQDCVLHRVDF